MLDERTPHPRRRPLGRLETHAAIAGLGVAVGALAVTLASVAPSLALSHSRLGPDYAPATAGTVAAPALIAKSPPVAPSSMASSEGATHEVSPVPSDAAPEPSSIVSSEGATHAVNVIDYTIRASLDPALHTVQANGTIVWRNTSRESVTELWLHLYLNGFKNENTLFLRARGGSGRGLLPITDWGYIDVHSLVAREFGDKDLWPDADKFTPGEKDDQTDIRVPLPAPVPAGGTLTLDVDWEDKLPNIVERTGCAGSFCMVAQWFPKLARLEPDGTWAHFPFYHLSEFYADFGTYDVTLSVPNDFVVGATGSCVSTKKEKARTELRYVQSDVHDFAFTAWNGFREKGTYSEGVRIRCLYPPGADDLAARELKTLEFALPYFGRRYGRYPYPVLTVVHPPRAAEEAGGMEYPTLITTGGDPLDPAGAHDVEIVTVHEFGHQYFYGLVASNEYQAPVLDEGLNTYAELDAMSELFGSGSAFEMLGSRVSLPAVYRLTSMRAGQNEPIAQPSSAFATGADYGAIVYARTGLLLMSLAGAYGKDAFANALADYARRYRFRHPSIADFISTIRDHLGQRAATNLETALYLRGWVDYEAADAESHPLSAPAGIFERNGKREVVAKGDSSVDRWEGTVLVLRRGNLELPVEIELAGEDGTRDRHFWDGIGNFVRIPYRGASRLARVIVDPSSKIMIDEDLLNNGLDLAGSNPRHRTLERALYAGELLLELTMP